MTLLRTCLIALGLACSTPAFAATWVVTTLADTPTQNQLTLRQAIAAANADSGGGLIVFAPALVAGADQTLTLRQATVTDGEGASAFVIDRDIRIEGPRGAHGITLDIAADVTARHFLVRRTGHLRLAHLSLTHGRAVGRTTAGSGGAIAVVGGHADLSGVYLAGNSADLDAAYYDCGGGAIFGTADGTAQPAVTLTNTTVYDNVAAYFGGAIYMTSGTLDLTFSTVARNRITGLNGAAAIFAETATLTFNASLLWNRKDAAGRNALVPDIQVGVLTGRYNFIPDEHTCMAPVPPYLANTLPTYCAAHDYHILAGTSALVAAAPVRQGGPTPALPAATMNGYVLQLELVPVDHPLCRQVREDGRGLPRPRKAHNLLLALNDPDFVDGGCDIGAFETQGATGDRWQDVIFNDALE